MRRRGLTVVRGSREETARAAWELVSGLPAEARLWVSPLGSEDGLGVGMDGKTPRQVQRLLGQTRTAVVLDLHGGLDGDTLGRVHGFIRGGGRLLLRLPEREEAAGDRMWGRLERALAAMETTSAPVAPVTGALGPTAEQDALVARLGETVGQCGVTVLRADRGRGKSAALGRVLAGLAEGCAVVLTGPSEAAVGEVVRFSGGRAQWAAPLEVLSALEAGRCPELVVVDEAAQLAVPLLQALTQAAPRAHMVFSTTVHGYEGTGRGFGLRFVDWLGRGGRPVVHETLRAPIRWKWVSGDRGDRGLSGAARDPLERFVFSLLMLDAAPVDVPVEVSAVMPELRFVLLDRDQLSRDEHLLKGVFGLLVAAHYRTTPGDLHRLLDAPDTRLHVALVGGEPVAVGWLVAEGGLSSEQVAGVLRGQRLRGQVLPETLCSHAGHPEAGGLRMWRSVRTAVHPQLRRQGIARRLVQWEHAHAAHAGADLMGTAFGATTALVGFRRSLGYRLVRLGVSRSARAGVPSAVMLWPRSEAAHALVDALQAELARDLPGQLALMDRERGLPVSDALKSVVLAGLPEPAVWTPERLDSRLRSYVGGSNPLDVLGPAAPLWLEGLPAGVVAAVSGVEGRALRARLLDGLGWHGVVAATGLPSVPAAQRAVRRAMRGLYDAHGLGAV